MARSASVAGSREGHSRLYVNIQDEYCAALEQREAAYGQLLEELRSLQGHAPISSTRTAGDTAAAHNACSCGSGATADCPAAGAQSSRRLPTRIPKPVQSGSKARPARAAEPLPAPDGPRSADAVRPWQLRPAANKLAAHVDANAIAPCSPTGVNSTLTGRDGRRLGSGHEQRGRPDPTGGVPAADPGSTPIDRSARDIARAAEPAELASDTKPLQRQTFEDSEISQQDKSTVVHEKPRLQDLQPRTLLFLGDSLGKEDVQRQQKGRGEVSQRVSAADLDRILGVTDEEPGDLSALLQSLHARQTVQSPGF